MILLPDILLIRDIPLVSLRGLDQSTCCHHCLTESSVLGKVWECPVPSSDMFAGTLLLKA